jgi:hypothetical protein
LKREGHTTLEKKLIVDGTPLQHAALVKSWTTRESREFHEFRHRLTPIFTDPRNGRCGDLAKAPSPCELFVYQQSAINFLRRVASHILELDLNAENNFK